MGMMAALPRQPTKIGLTPKMRGAQRFDQDAEQAFEELDVTSQFNPNHIQHMKKLAIFRRQQANLSALPLPSQMQGLDNLPSIAKPKVSNPESSMMSAMQQKRNSLQPLKLSNQILHSGIVSGARSPKVALPMLKPKRQSPMHQVLLEREMNRHLLADAAAQSTEAQLRKDERSIMMEFDSSSQARHSNDGDMQSSQEDTQATHGLHNKRKMLRVGMA